jgi:hypothetical protein
MTATHATVRDLCKDRFQQLPRELWNAVMDLIKYSKYSKNVPKEVVPFWLKAVNTDHCVIC